VTTRSARGRARSPGTRAVRVVAATPVGLVALCLLTAGFVGLALWRLAEPVCGGPGPGGQVAAAVGALVLDGAHVAYSSWRRDSLKQVS
jgi:hypothetical protein